MTASFPTPQKPLGARSGNRPGRRRFASLRSILALMLREMTTTFGRTPGGYIWAILEPALGIGVLTYAFSFVFREPPIGTTFQLFYATGMLPFLMFTMITNRVGAALVFSRQLLVYPAVTFLDAIIARFLVNALTQVLVFYVVMTGIMLIYDTRAILDFSAIGASLVLTAVFGFAMGTLNAYLFMRFKLWHVAWSLISRPLFLLSGVIFMYDALPGQLKTFLWYNPLVHIVGVMRRGFYPSYVGDYISPLYVVGVSLALTLIGLRMLSWHAAILIHEP